MDWTQVSILIYRIGIDEPLGPRPRTRRQMEVLEALFFSWSRNMFVSSEALKALLVSRPHRRRLDQCAGPGLSPSPPLHLTYIHEILKQNFTIRLAIIQLF